MPAFLAYHDVSSAQHQTHVDTLAPQGYRPISLNVSGDPANARYAAVWVQRPGSAWAAVHNVSSGEFHNRSVDLQGRGYAPTLASAAGPVQNATYMGLFEQGATGPWYARRDLRWDPSTDPGTITHENEFAFRNGFIPRCLVAYGTPADRRFAGIWVKNTDRVAWSWWFADPGTYQNFFDALVKGRMRPAWITVAPDGWILAVFRDDFVGEWWARHNIDSAAYQAEFNTRVAGGALPICVQAGGTGSAARYASIFAHDTSVEPRAWTVRGTPATKLPGLDAIVSQFMAPRGIRAAALTVRSGSVDAVSRGYTWAEASYPVTQPDSLFRIASLSKLFTAACIQRLKNLGKLTGSEGVYPLLGITAKLLADQTPNTAINQVTVDQLVAHTSGMRLCKVDDGAGGTRIVEPSGDLRAVARRLGITTTPTRDQIVRFMYGEALEFQPGSPPAGTPYVYSNFGYTLLTSVIERIAGRPYIDYLRNDLLAAEGIANVWTAATSLSGRRTGEVFYENAGIALSMLQPAAPVMAPNAYGGTFTLENGEGSGGLVTSAPTIASVISRHAAWGIGGRTVATRYGRFDGTATIARSRGDNVDWSLLFNRILDGAELDQITAAIEGYLDTHAVA